MSVFCAILCRSFWVSFICHLVSHLRHFIFTMYSGDLENFFYENLIYHAPRLPPFTSYMSPDRHKMAQNTDVPIFQNTDNLRILPYYLRYRRNETTII